jgi:SAM-dependent methyltransferase
MLMIPHPDHPSSHLPSTRVTWRQADAQHLPFPDGEFDAVVCQFGVMFFPDKPRAFSEACHVLKPGGRFLFNVGDRIEENEFADIVVKSVATLFRDNPPMFLARTPLWRAKAGRPLRLAMISIRSAWKPRASQCGRNKVLFRWDPSETPDDNDPHPASFGGLRGPGLVPTLFRRGPSQRSTTATILCLKGRRDLSLGNDFNRQWLGPLARARSKRFHRSAVATNCFKGPQGTFR